MFKNKRFRSIVFLFALFSALDIIVYNLIGTETLQTFEVLLLAFVVSWINEYN